MAATAHSRPLHLTAAATVPTLSCLVVDTCIGCPAEPLEGAVACRSCGNRKRQRQKANRALKQQQVEQAASRRKMTRRIAIGVAAVAGVFLVAWIASNFVADDEPPHAAGDGAHCLFPT